MKRIQVLLTISCLFVLSASADDGSHAKALLAKASELNNFSGQNAKPFQLQASFRALHTKSGDLSGEYRLFWKGENEFRVEDHLSDFHEIVVRDPKKSWRLSNLVMAPSQVNDITNLIREFQKPGLDGLEHFSKVRPEKIGDLAAQCFDAKNMNLKLNLCFDSTTGTVARVKESGDGATTVYRFSDYAQVGAKLYPRKISMERNGSATVEVTIESLEDWTPKPEQLSPPVGAVSHVVCDIKDMKAPHAVYTPDPRWPEGMDHSGIHHVALRGLVSAEGRFVAVEVTKSGGPAFDQEAIRAVKQWKVEPARCGNEPTEVQINVEINFQ